MKAKFASYFKEHFGIKIFAKLIIFIFIISASFTVFLIYNQTESLKEDMFKQGTLLAKILAENSRIGVFSENKELLNNPVNGIFLNEGVIGVSVFNLDGKLLKMMEKPEIKNRQKSVKEEWTGRNQIFDRLRKSESMFYIEGKSDLEFWSPVFAGSGYLEEESLLLEEELFQANERPIGFVRILVDKKLLNKRISDLLHDSIIIGCAFLTIGSISTYFMVKGVTRPLNRLTESAKALEMGRAAEKVPVETGDQIGKLAMAFNSMSESLKNRENALRESELKYRTIFENTSDGISVYEQFCGSNTLKLIDCNESYAIMAGRQKDELISIKNIKQIQAKDSKSGIEFNKLKNIQNDKGPAYEGTFSWKRPDNRENYIEYRAVTVIMGERIFVYGIDRDITKRRQAEKQVHSLTHELLIAQEAERLRISRDLHDHIAQDLSSMKIACESLINDLPEGPFETKKMVLKISTMLQKSIMAVRDLSYNLRPPGLDQLGLVRTIYQYCEDFSDSNGIKVDFISGGLESLTLGFDTEINLYRVIQETLNNVKKHADASLVVIRLVASHPYIILRVEDNGKGFDVKERLTTALNEKRMGFRSIEERINLLMGTIRVNSTPMEGTKILIQIPYKEDDHGTKKKHSYC